MANFSSFNTHTRRGDSGYHKNPLLDYEEMLRVQKEATQYASRVISSTPDGVVTGGLISVNTVRKNPIRGGIFLVGVIVAPIIFLGFVGNTVRGIFFPAPIAEAEPMHHRAGNAVGRNINTFWNLSKPGVAALEVQWRQESATKYGGASQSAPNSPNSPTPIVSTQIPGLTLTTNPSTTQVKQTGLSQAEQQAISNFLK